MRTSKLFVEKIIGRGWEKIGAVRTRGRLRHSFICQCISTRRERRDLFGLRIKLLPVIASLTTLKVEAIPLSALPKNTTSELAGLSFSKFFDLTRPGNRIQVYWLRGERCNHAPFGWILCERYRRPLYSTLASFFLLHVI